jgi:DNA repair exonuclease SbcCD ATPase subunit
VSEWKADGHLCITRTDDKGHDRFKCWDVDLSTVSLAAWINDLEAQLATTNERALTAEGMLASQANGATWMAYEIAEQTERANAAETAYQRDSAAWHELRDTLVRQRDEALRQLETAEHDATHMQQVATICRATTDAANAKAADAIAALDDSRSAQQEAEALAQDAAHALAETVAAHADMSHRAEMAEKMTDKLRALAKQQAEAKNAALDRLEAAEADCATLAEALRQAEADAAAYRKELEVLFVPLSEPGSYLRRFLAGADAGKALLAQVAAMRAALELVAKGANIGTDAGARTLARLAQLERIEAAARAWQAAWDAAEAFQRHEHTWADGTRDYSDGLWQTETERALDLKATLEAK